METITKSWHTDKVADAINPELFDAFQRGYLPGFRIKNFLPADEANAVGNEVAPYVEEYTTAPGVGRIGVTLVEHPDFEDYAARSAVPMNEAISHPQRMRLVNYVSGYLTLHTGLPIRPLVKDGKICFHGLFRKINTGAGAHVDILSEDNKAFSSRRPKFQASIVVHLLTPPAGGTTVLWDRRAMPGDKKFLRDDWQYLESFLDSHIKVEVPCVAGELVILSTINYHMVTPSLPADATRLSFSMFLVIFEDEPNVIYIYN